MARKFTVIIEKDNDGWLVSEVVELPGCHTQAKTLDQLIERTKEAIDAYLEDEKEPIVFPEFIHVPEVEEMKMIIKRKMKAKKHNILKSRGSARRCGNLLMSRNMSKESEIHGMVKEIQC